MDDLYHEILLDHADQPREFGHLATPSHRGVGLNASCGDTLQVELVLDSEGRVQDISWTGEGCAISMATASLLAEKARGKKIEELQGLELSEILVVLGLESLAPARIKCARLFVNALQRIEHV